MRFKKVLILDDDALDLYVSKRVLKNSSFAEEVIATATVKDAMDYIRSNTAPGSFPDFIFLDLNMPGQNGLDFLHEFSAFTEKNNVSCPVALLMSVINSPDTITKKAKEHPLVKYVFEKPLTDELLKRIT
jgi:CheY-like chemotaxis protein